MSVFKGKQIYLVERSSNTPWKRKQDARQSVASQGATINFTLNPSTSFVIVVNEYGPGEKTNCDIVSARKLNPSLYSIYLKTKKWNIPMYREGFIQYCVQRKSILINSVSDTFKVKENDVVVSSGTTSYFSTNNNNHYNLDDDESVYSTEVMEDLFNFGDDEDEEVDEDAIFRSILEDDDAPVQSKKSVQKKQGKDKTRSSIDEGGVEEQEEGYNRFITIDHDLHSFVDGRNGVIYSTEVESIPTISYESVEQQIQFIKEEEEQMFNIEYPSAKPGNPDTIFLDKGYAFYTCDTENTLKFIDLPEKLKGISVVETGYKSTFTAFIDYKKHLYVWGRLNPSISYYPIRKLLLPNNRHTKFNQVVTCNSNLLALDGNGKCWYINTQNRGDGYSGDEERSFRTLSPIDFLPIAPSMKIIMVSCGLNSCTLLTEQKRVMTWGSNDVGQLGRFTYGNRRTFPPTYIDELDNVTFISSGNNHTMVIKGNEETGYGVYGWGLNHKKQLGLDVGFTNQPTTIVSTSKSKKKIFCANDFSVVTYVDNSKHQSIVYSKEFDFKFELDYLNSYMESIQDYDLFIFKKKLGIKTIHPYQMSRGLIINKKKDLLESLMNDQDSSIITDGQKTMLLHLAASIDSLECFKLLFKLFPDHQLDKSTKSTVIHTSAKSNSTGVLKYLLEDNTVSCDAVDLTKSTALHHVCTLNNFESAVLLLEYRCDRNVVNAKGHTAFHLSVTKNSYPISLLLAQKAAQSLPDLAMKTPIQYAQGDEKQILQGMVFQNEIFLSYAHKDSSFVKDLRLGFELSSLRCWLDEYRLQAGCDWRAEITKGVENSRVVVFTVSSTSIASLWCRKELKMAKKLAKPIIALYYQELELDPILKGLFDYEIHFKTLYSDMDPSNNVQKKEEFSRVSRLVKTVVEGSKTTSSTTLQKKKTPSQQELYDMYKGKSMYLSFSGQDFKLFWFIKEYLLAKGVPIMDRDEVDGTAQKRVKELKDTKKKMKQQQKQIQKTKQQQKNHQQVEETQQSIYNHVHNIYSFTPDLFDKVQENQYDFDQTYVDAPVIDTILHLKPYLETSLLHIIIYSSFNKDAQLDHDVEMEIQHSQSHSIPCIVITNDYQLKSSSPTMLKEMTWYEITHQREDEFFDKIINIYEMLEKTYTITKQLKSLQHS